MDAPLAGSAPPAAPAASAPAPVPAAQAPAVPAPLAAQAPAVESVVSDATTTVDSATQAVSQILGVPVESLLPVTAQLP